MDPHGSQGIPDISLYDGWEKHAHHLPPGARSHIEHCVDCRTYDATIGEVTECILQEARRLTQFLSAKLALR